MEDMNIPARKEEMLEEAQKEVSDIEHQYTEGLITDGERYNKVIDIWASVTEQIASEMMREIGTDVFTEPNGTDVRTSDSFNSIFMMANSGSRGSAQQIRQLAGMRGLMAKPSGEIIETPITANFREGLTVLQYFISTHGARKGLADTALKTANSGYLTRRLVDVANDTIVLEYDCGTLDGIEASALVEGGEVIEKMTDRVLGRVALDDIYDPYSGDIIVEVNQEIDEAKLDAIEAAGLESVQIRSALTCRTRSGVCVLCYGRDLARGHLINIGETVGVIAAQSIGEPGTQLTMRTFHIGGTASRMAEQSTLESRTEGTVRFHNMSTVSKADGSLVVMNRIGEVGVVDDTGREREKNPLPYGAKLHKQEGDTVAAGELIAEWDPWSLPVLTEMRGFVKFVDIVEGVTMQEQLDERTGLASKVIIESKDGDLRPRIVVQDESGKTLRFNVPGRAADKPTEYALPVRATITVSQGATVDAGDVLAKIPRETTKTKDITGGLPRVAELFEARKPKEHAIISEIEGAVTFGKVTKGKRKVVVTPEVGEPKEYLVPKGKHITVHEGEFVRAGDPLMEGSRNPHDILRVLGEKELAKYLVDEVQQVYRLQGVKINDKHIELIVRQMLRWIRVTDVGDTRFLVDEQVDRWSFEEENESVIALGGRPAVGEPMLLGITKASLSTESFLSASSFQETTKVLTEASVCGKVDRLRGLKENVIMGRLIPAGTGVPAYKDVKVKVTEEAVERKMAE
jgi:DNA-directed RNA polymerase subunit beta'